MGKFAVAAMAPVLFVLGVTPFSNASEVFANNLKVQTENGVAFVSGGFGLEERAALRTMGEKDNLELSFALQNKEYLGGAKILIKDETGNQVLETVSDGPLFYAKLRKGKYIVMATAQGKTLTQTAEVPDKGQARLYFAWKETEATPTLAQK
jgi:hypothetical protein